MLIAGGKAASGKEGGRNGVKKRLIERVISLRWQGGTEPGPRCGNSI